MCMSMCTCVYMRALLQQGAHFFQTCVPIGCILFERSNITRESTRIVFRTDNYEGALYKRSPYFVESKL